MLAHQENLTFFLQLYSGNDYIDYFLRRRMYGHKELSSPLSFLVISDINSKFTQFVSLTWACLLLPTNNTYCLVSYYKSLYNFVSWLIASVPPQS
jgi:hypothetical protein